MVKINVYCILYMQTLGGVKMPDITMCDDRNCGIRNKCYRFRAIPDEWRQSYFRGSVRKPNEPCKHFVALEGGDILQEESK
jgi:hypothetical protein